MTKEEFLRTMQQDTEYIAEFAEFTRDIQKETERLLYEFNRSSPDEEESRAELLKNSSVTTP